MLERSNLVVVVVVVVGVFVVLVTEAGGDTFFFCADDRVVDTFLFLLAVVLWACTDFDVGFLVVLSSLAASLCSTMSAKS